MKSLIELAVGLKTAFQCFDDCEEILEDTAFLVKWQRYKNLKALVNKTMMDKSDEICPLKTENEGLWCGKYLTV